MAGAQVVIDFANSPSFEDKAAPVYLGPWLVPASSAAEFRDAQNLTLSRQS